MADQQYLDLIDKGAVAWNKWRKENSEIIPDLEYASLCGKDLSYFNFSKIRFSGADFTGANLYKANFDLAISSPPYPRSYYPDEEYEEPIRTKMSNVNCKGASFRWAQLSQVDFFDADLQEAVLNHADLEYCNFTNANLEAARLIEANIERAQIIDSNFTNTILELARIIKCEFTNSDFTGASIYGISTWDVILNNCKQNDLCITKLSIPFLRRQDNAITVDSLELAQFIYLLLDNKKVREVIDTITSKVVLILGRFTEERKAVLDSIRENLRTMNLTPILFDFEKPASKDLTGTVETLARMARFIIADLTDPSSIPHELATIIPSLRTTPVLPIRLKGSGGYSMFTDFQKDLPHRVLETYEYTDSQSLIAALPQIIAPANEKADAFRSGI